MMSKPVYVNDKEIFEKYKARLLKYTIGAVNISESYLTHKNSIIPVKLKESVGTRKITLELEFEGDTCYESTMNISNMTAELLEETELQLPDGFFYYCLLDSVSDPECKGDTFYTVKFVLVGYRHLPMVTETFTESGYMQVQGNLPAPAIITISDATGTVKVNDIQVDNIVNTVVIDGFEKTVMEVNDGTTWNKFKDCSMTKFPRFEPGPVLVEITGDCTVTIEYKPILL